MNKTYATTTRSIQLERIERHAKQLHDISESFDVLSELAHDPKAEDAFINLVEAVATLTLGELSRLGKIMTQARELKG